jgi:hypothetical protein
MEQLNAFIEMPGNEITIQSIAAYAILLGGAVKITDAWDWAHNKYESRKTANN